MLSDMYSHGNILQALELVGCCSNFLDEFDPIGAMGYQLSAITKCEGMPLSFARMALVHCDHMVACSSLFPSARATLFLT